jgi:hypothetical protein
LSSTISASQSSLMTITTPNTPSSVVSSTFSYHQQQQQQHHNYLMSHSRNYKRKTAVELLAESKPFYVKSETVLDRQQQLIRGSGNNSISCKRFIFLGLYFSLLYRSFLIMLML